MKQILILYILILVIVSCLINSVHAELPRMLSQAKVSNINDLDIPHIETWPASLIYTFDNTSDYTSTEALNVLPKNKTAANFCPQRITRTADYYWSLCPANQDLSSTTLHCTAIQMYVLSKAQECMEFRDNYITTVTSKQLKGTGFWSNRCRCFPVITRLLTLLSNSVGWQYCSNSNTELLNQNFQTVYSSGSSLFVTSPWISLFNGVDDLIDTTIAKIPAEAAFISIFKTNWPYYIDFLAPEKWNCYDDIPGYAENYYGSDITPYSVEDIEYLENLYFAIPPDNAYIVSNNNIPSTGTSVLSETPTMIIAIPIFLVLIVLSSLFFEITALSLLTIILFVLYNK